MYRTEISFPAESRITIVTLIMSWIKDISELSTPIKGFLLSLILVMPIWYLDLLLFDNFITLHGGMEIPIIISFCLTIALMFLHALITMFMGEIFSYKKVMLGYHNIGFIYMMTVSALVTILAFTYIGYMFCFTFKTFANCVFGFTILQLIIFFGIHTMINNGRNPNQNNTL